MHDQHFGHPLSLRNTSWMPKPYLNQWALGEFFLYSAVEKVKLIISVLYSDPALFSDFRFRSAAVWGAVDHCGDAFPFDMTEYYSSEMGKGLFRTFLSYVNLVDAVSLPWIKELCEELEREYSLEGRRRLNLDPGYIDLGKLVLASCKYGHQKIPVSPRVYADPVLHFRRSSCESFDWTFPDFRDPRYHSELCSIRNLYKEQLKKTAQKGK